MLWADKYRPSDFNELVGNLPSVRALDEWIRSWDAIHIAGTKPKPAFASYGKDKGLGAKAALISGPPGIGKTTTATLLGKRYGYDVLELNASDNRAAKTLHGLLSSALGSTVIQLDAAKTSESVPSFSSPAFRPSGELKRLVIMDEVDGMSGGDRGGNAELIKLIKTTRVPLICICNDRNDAKVRSLANSCYDVKFVRPPKEAIAARLKSIAATEGLNVELSAAEALAESCGGDIRQMLSEFLTESSTKLTPT